MLKGLFVLVTSAAVLFIFLNPSYFLEKYEQFKEKKHTEQVDKRLEISPKIQMLLDKLLLSTQANRTFIIEFHNGTNNLNGLPFLFGDITYEETNGIDYISDLYQNVPLARFKIANELFDNGYWYGNIDSLMKIDKRLSSRMSINNTEWAAFILLRGSDNYIGVIGVSFRDSLSVNKEIVGKQLRTAAINTIALLDNL